MSFVTGQVECSLWASVLLSADWDNANTSWLMSQIQCQGPLRGGWSRPIRCCSVYSCVNHHGRKSQDIWAKNKESIPSRSLGIMVNCQSPRKGVERRFCWIRGKCCNEAAMHCGARFSQSSIPSTIPRSWCLAWAFDTGLHASGFFTSLDL